MAGVGVPGQEGGWAVMPLFTGRSLPTQLGAAPWCLWGGAQRELGNPSLFRGTEWPRHKGPEPVFSKGSKCLLPAPFPGLGCHPELGRRHPEVTRVSVVKAALGPVRCVLWVRGRVGVFGALGATVLRSQDSGVRASFRACSGHPWDRPGLFEACHWQMRSRHNPRVKQAILTPFRKATSFSQQTLRES